jgi:hypothetical protein
VKGIARTILLMLCWGGLTRWLVGIGLFLTATGLGALTYRWHPDLLPLFRLQVLVGVALGLISPLLVGGVVFRSLSAARAVALIPNGRLQLVLGAFLSYLLLSLWVGVAVNMTRGASVGLVFATAFAILSVQFFGYYWSSQYRLGGLWLLSWIVWLQPFIGAFKVSYLRDWLNTASGISVVVLMSLCAWLAFAVLYLRARRVGVPVLNGFLILTRTAAKASRFASDPHDGAAHSPDYTRRYAARTLLLGIAWNRRSIWQRLFWGILIVLIVGLPAHLPAQLIGAVGHSIGNSFAWVPIQVVAGPVAWSFAFTMTQRARLLWLSSGLARVELFRLVESYAWRLMLISICVVMLLTVPRFLLGIRDFSGAVQLALFMAIPFASGAAFLYGGMSYVTGRKLTGTLITAVCAAFWLVNLAFPLTGTAAPAPTLLALQIVLVPVLRALALRQWRDIDWLLNRPKRLPVRLA